MYFVLIGDSQKVTSISIFTLYWLCLLFHDKNLHYKNNKMWNNVGWVCLHRISSIVLIYASIKRRWHKCIKGLWEFARVCFCVAFFWSDWIIKNLFWCNKKVMISFYCNSCVHHQETNMNIEIKRHLTTLCVK